MLYFLAFYALIACVLGATITVSFLASGPDVTWYEALSWGIVMGLFWPITLIIRWL